MKTSLFTIFIILKKEFIEYIRDTRTVVISFIVPLFLFPLLSVIMLSNQNDYSSKIKIGTNELNNLTEYLTDFGNIDLIISKKNPKELIENNDCNIFIDFSENFDIKAEYNEMPTAKLIYNPSNKKSIIASDAILNYLTAYSQKISSEKINMLNIPQYVISPINIKVETISDVSESAGNLLLSVIIPLLAIIFTVSCPLPAVCDSFAGEKERRTIEPLLTSVNSRFDLILGKYFASVIIGYAGVLCFFISVIVSYLINKRVLGEISLNLEVGTFFLILLFMFLLTLITVAVEINISIFSKSIKEAQSYSIPLLFAMLTLNYIADKISINSFWSIYIPILNILLNIRSVMGLIIVSHIIVTSIISFATVLLLLRTSHFLLRKESIIYRV